MWVSARDRTPAPPTGLLEPPGRAAPSEAPSRTGGAAPGHDDAEERQRPVPEDPTTPGGLPVRVPQASLAPPLRAGEAPGAARPEPEPGPERRRSPAEIQRIMGSYQRGSRLGRSAAGRAEPLRDTTTPEGEDDQ